MNFKKLEVYGFKSFADKLTVEFDNGITAIVGPNGCGKSNVGDSIRWALGEQSPKSLRGGSMADVIFKGTESRKSLSYCEVLLYFDNTTRSFNSDFDEVVISRKLYRSGESEYAINKTTCRLKDITELLHNSGLGKDSYSIIGQGRIDEILSAKPENRRSIFEDAAGISKYKHVKVDNERKLVRVEEKMGMAIAIIQELEKSLPSLKNQSEKAVKFLELKEQQRYYDINNYIIQYEGAAGKKAEVQLRLDEVTSRFDAAQKEHAKSDKEYAFAMESTSKLDEEIRLLNNRRLEYTIKIERAESQSKILGEKIGYLRQENERLSAEIVGFDGEFKRSTETLESLFAKRTEIDAETVRLREELDGFNNRYIELTDKLSKGEGAAEQSRRDILEAMNKLSDIKANMSRMQEQQVHLAEKIKVNSDKAESMHTAVADDEVKAAELKVRVDGLYTAMESAKAEHDKALEQHGAAVMRQRDLSLEADRSLAAYHSMESQLKMLTAIHNDMRNYAESVKMLINAAKTEPELKGRVEGVVARLITVEPEYSTAIDMALGAAAQNIITPTDADAKVLIEYLKRNRGGRATFLPISVMKPRYVDENVRRRLGMKGCLGVASELVGYESKYDGVIKGLLGGTVITDNLDSAVEFAKAVGHSVKVVTLEGDVINPRGSMTGGSRKSDASNLIGTENQIAELTEKLRTVEARAKAGSQERAKLVELIESLSVKVRAKNGEHTRLEIDYAKESDNYNKLTKQIDFFRAERDNARAEADKAAATLKEIDDKIKSADDLEEQISRHRAETSTAADKSQKEFDILRAERDDLHSRITNIKVRVAGLISEHSATDNEISRLQKLTTQLAYNIDSHKVQIKKNNDDIDCSITPLACGEGIDDGVAKKLAEVSAKLTELENFKDECSERVLILDESRQRLQSELMQLSEYRFREEKNLSDIDTSLSLNTEKLEEEYNLNYEQCKELRDENYDDDKGRIEAARLRKEIMRMGYINPESIDEYKSLKARVDEEYAQKDDLEKSIADIRKIIREMETEMLSRFNTSFDQIRQNFSIVFRQLFGGGNARLVLEEADNPLEAGIEIVAEPPGKKLQSISLLSGGERALTAIAILFAILKLRPMPFCVLDEIEAALDDANAERFAKYLHNFSQDTQFIVITHRKPTMELADALYGVTMEEKGVSKIISVKLEDAVAAVGE